MVRNIELPNSEIMDDSLNKKIDKLWRDTDVGKYIAYSVNEEYDKLSLLVDKLFSIHPYWQAILRNQSKEIVTKMLNTCSKSELQSYFSHLEKKEPETAYFITSHAFFEF